MVFLASAFGVVAFIIGLFTPLSPFWRDVWVAAALLYLAGVWVFQYRELVATGVRRIFPPKAMQRLVREDPFIPLSQAARELYEANINGMLGAAARQDAGGGADPLLWCCYWIAPRFPEIYGSRPPSTVLERVPSELFTYAHFQDRGDILVGGDGGDYVGLCVKQEAFRAVLPILGEMPRSERG